MSTIFIAFVVIALTVLIFGNSTFFIKTDKKKKANLFLRLSQEGSVNNLTFCSQEILQNKLVGIDGIHRKIMVLEKINNKYQSSIISLDDVRNCELVTRSGSLNSGHFKKIQIETKPDAIELRFEFKNQVPPASIIFYNNLINSKRELVLLKAKAEYWNVMLSKMLPRQVRAERA